MFSATSPIPYLMIVVALVVLILLNEVARRSRLGGILCFIVLPVVLTIFVWIPQTMASEANTWFSIAKVYSALAGCIGFMAIRYIPKVEHSKFAWFFPPLILAINIAEAVSRDFQNASLAAGVTDMLFKVGGSWNVMNGIAGILNIITICGFVGICVSKKKSEDMLWPDMIWPWILAYDLWNFAFVYNNGASAAGIAGIALLLSCTILTFFWSKGAWLQHRASTLAFYMMFKMTFPTFFTWDIFALGAPTSTTPYFIISLISLLANVAVAAYEIYVVAKTRRNPLKGEIYVDTKAYKEVKAMARD